ncbi:MAG: S8 family serine peptidase, partial [Candidatus Eremiobacteraeota bacterium]|nr:S8 family serine peptidase [Candidatus Eremiobacteraeota bacterium]
SNHRHIGIAPRASLVGIKAFDSEGKGKGSDVIEAIQWAVANKQRLGIEVINLSARSIAKYSHRQDPMARAVAAAWDRGIVPVVAAGNDGPKAETIGSPAHEPRAISVGALDDRGSTDTDDDRMYRGSSRGPTPVDGLDKPDVVAPGVNIRAMSTHNGYVTKTGTSMAAPMVSGLVALLLTQHHDATPAQIKQAVTAGAQQLPRLGDRHDQGSGLVNAPRALAALTVEQAEALVEA